MKKLARQQIDEGVKSLEGGRSDQAVRGILGFVLLVTTLVMKQPWRESHAGRPAGGH